MSLLLGIIVLLDLTTFWGIACSLRGVTSRTYLTMTVALIITGCYYLAASLVILAELDSWPDLDADFSEKKHFVLAGVLVANWLLFAGTTVLRRQFVMPYFGSTLIMTALFSLLAVLRRRSLWLVLEIFVLAKYLAFG